MARFLVTGVAGFIGRSIAAALLERGESVRGIDSFITGRRETHVTPAPSVSMSPAAYSILGAIGRTPIVRLRRTVPAGAADVIIKLESTNPTGSYKDRMALAMIEGAEQRRALLPGMRVVEYTGGSTGSSLAMVCAAKRYSFIVLSSDAFAREKLLTMEAFGAVFGAAPQSHAAAGWQLNAYALVLESDARLRYASDTRGTHAFLPVIGSVQGGCVQIPTSTRIETRRSPIVPILLPAYAPSGTAKRRTAAAPPISSDSVTRNAGKTIGAIGTPPRRVCCPVIRPPSHARPHSQSGTCAM